MSDTNKICPKCESEYLPKAQNCPDCLVALVFASDPKSAHVPCSINDANWDNIPEDTILGQVTSDIDHIIETYLGFFKAEGIQAAVVPDTYYDPGEIQYSTSVVFGTQVTGGSPGQIPIGNVVEGFHYLLFVNKYDYEQAQGIIDREFADLHPGQEEGFSKEFDNDNCPACGCGLHDGAIECPDCGLNFS